MKNQLIRLKTMLLAGAIVLTSSALTGCGGTTKEDISPKQIAEATSAHFGIGAHIISVPITTEKDIRDGQVQYESYPGYEPIGISITACGEYNNVFSGGAIMYSNVEEVECTSCLVDESGNVLYSDFGTPTQTTEEKDDLDRSIGEFGIGEHIISIPVPKDNRKDQVQYEYHAGYEVVGISSSSYGKYSNIYGGGVVLYKNIVPVRCTRGDNGYNVFGVPIEVEKTKTLK